MAEEDKKYEGVFSTDQLSSESQEDIWFRSEMFKLLEKIVEDKFAEQKLENFPLWMAASKSLKLTFFDDRDANILTNLFEAEVCRYLRSLPPNKQNFATYQQLGQARMLFLANVKRSVGTPIQKINERIAVLSQWKITQPLEQSPVAKPGIWKRIFG